MITLQEAKQVLRVDHDDDDAYISGIIASITATALSYTRDPEIINLDLDEHPLIRSALIVGVAEMYDAGPQSPFYEAMAPFLQSYRVWEF